MIINKDKEQNLERYYSYAEEATAVFVTGEKGLGKSTIIQNFEAKQSDTIHVRAFGNSAFYLEPVVHAINAYLQRKHLAEDYFPSLQSGFSIEENITRKIIEIAVKQRIVLVFESINLFDSALLLFCRNIIEAFLKHYTETKTFIIAEIDTDDDLAGKSNSLTLESFYSLSPKIRFIRVSRLASEYLTEYFFSIFHGKIDIAEEDCNYIIQSSFGNIMYLNIVVNYLKQIGLIYDDGYRTKCKQLPRGILSQVLRQNIITRFDKLDDGMKYVLSQSSIIGRVFDKRILYSQFQILQADELLQQIECISQLIVELNEYQYSFENDEVYNLIQNKIPVAEKNEWHSILAEYYKNQIEFSSLTGSISSESYINNIYLVAYHYENCQKFSQALPFYLRLVSLYVALMDYRKAIETIERVEKQFDCAKYAHGYEKIRSELMIRNADCHRMLGNYEKAINLYTEAESRYDRFLEYHILMEARLGLAYCLHMKGELNKSLAVALKMKDELKHDQQTRLFFQVLALLSSVYDLLGDYSQSQLYYRWSLEHCSKYGLEHEYYTQLKKASMVLDLQISQPMQKAAAQFFERQQNIREFAETLHNLGTDNLYLMERTSAEQYIEKSIALYKQFDSSAVHYPLNSKAILLSVDDYNPREALQILNEALSYLSQKAELLSQVTLQINCATILMQLGRYEEAHQRIVQSDSLINSSDGRQIPFCQIYSCFAWALYYIYTNQKELAIVKLVECLEQPDLPAKHQYLAANLLLELDPTSTILPNLRQMADIVCEPLMEEFFHKHLFFATLRCWE